MQAVSRSDASPRARNFGSDDPGRHKHGMFQSRGVTCRGGCTEARCGMGSCYSSNPISATGVRSQPFVPFWRVSGCGRNCRSQMHYR